MSQHKFPKAYEAYQQAVYRDGRNPTFWCSIGVLYYQINQYRDALDAYSRAIRLNPNISEVWYDLGTLVCQSLLLSLKSVLTIHSMNPATTRLAMRWMPMSVPLSSTQRTGRSRLDCNCSAVAKVVGQMVKMALRYLKTCNLTTTRHLEPHQMDHQHNGELPKVLVN
jgi:tetratricopeptide (TPR) repeat protein